MGTNVLVAVEAIEPVEAIELGKCYVPVYTQVSTTVGVENIG